MAITAQIARGRSFAIVLEPGESVLPALALACSDAGIVQGYIPVFSGAFRTATVIGTHESIEDDDAPLADSVTVRNAEGLGSGTIATTDGALGIHLHVAIGEKAAAAGGTTGHLVDATVQYPVEVIVEEILSPRFERRSNPAARGIATLGFVVD